MPFCLRQACREHLGEVREVGRQRRPVRPGQGVVRAACGLDIHPIDTHHAFGDAPKRREQPWKLALAAGAL